jgi:hypothetical protein
MLTCNQNGVMGKLVYEAEGIEIWNTPAKNSNDGWIGIFNRSDIPKTTSLKQQNLGLASQRSYSLRDIWNNEKMSVFSFSINPNGVVFLKYTTK